MGSYFLPGRDIPLDDGWDVVVAGGGPAGCAAAAAAARDGARTLLLEATGALGGMGTSGLVPAWCPFSDKRRIIYGGIAEKVFRTLRQAMPHVPADQDDWAPIDAERLKRIYDDLVTEAGASVRFHTLLAGVERREGAVDALILAGKAGLTACRARIYVDCTGDADLAAWAGAEWAKGDEAGACQPATHCFLLTNVDTYAYHYRGRIKHGGGEPIIDRIIQSGRYPLIPDNHACNSLVGPGAIGFNAGHLWDVDNTDCASVSAALMQGRKLAAAYRDALAEFFPEAFGGAHLAATGSLMGIRETRRIVGDYVLTVADYLARRSFADEVCRNCYFVDVHAARAEDKDGLGFEAVVHGRFEHYAPGESHGIPYRCLTPKGLANVLVAGRSISTDRHVQGSTRVMPVCLAMGEAAGAAAAMAARAAPADVHAVDTDALRRRLREAGAYLP